MAMDAVPVRFRAPPPSQQPYHYPWYPVVSEVSPSEYNTHRPVVMIRGGEFKKERVSIRVTTCFTITNSLTIYQTFIYSTEAIQRFWSNPILMLFSSIDYEFFCHKKL
jgi:hypothetical protein